MELLAVLPGAPTLCVLGFQQVAVDLGFLGAPGCSLLTDPALTWFLLADSLGSATQLVDVPVDQALVGQHLFVQFGAGDPRANTFGLVTSNGVDVTIGGVRGH